MRTPLDLLDDAIAELEARLNLRPGQDVPATIYPDGAAAAKGLTAAAQSKKKKSGGSGATTTKRKPPAMAAEDDDDLPVICKMEFKVGVITKVWVHESADTLYCEEIDVGESTGPRLIASGLRNHFSLAQMLGQRLLVVANLKARNLVGFKSHGMVLCCAATSTNDDGVERVEFVEPPADAVIGEVITFTGLPPPRPAAPSQVEKQKIFAQCAAGLAMTTTTDRVAVWNGHAFMTSAGPCTVPTIAGGVLR